MVDFEDLALGDLLGKVDRKVTEIAESRNLNEFKSLGESVQSVYNFFVTAKKDYENIQPMLKNLFSSFNYAAVIINDAIKTKKTDAESGELISECLEIMSACCRNIRSALGL